MADILKRNIGLTVFVLISLVAGIILLLLVRQQASRAGELQTAVEDQVAFFEGIARERVAVTRSNLEIAERNRALAEARLGNLRAMLWNRSNIPIPRYRGVEAINILRQETALMQEALFERRVQIPAGIRRFSFGAVLDRDALPDEETEVPVLMKQLELVKEIVRLAGESYITEFTDLQRLTGATVVEGEHYNILPFRVVVTGELPRVKRFVTRLQRDAAYFFLVHHVQVQAADSVQEAVRTRPVAAVRDDRVPGMGDQRFAPDMRAPLPPRQGRRTTQPEDIPADPEPEPLTQEERMVALSDMATATIRFDFVEFSAPEQEN